MTLDFLKQVLKVGGQFDEGRSRRLIERPAVSNDLVDRLAAIAPG